MRLSDTGLIATALGAFAFVAGYAYSTRGRWKKTVFGRQVMTFMAVILAVCILAISSMIWGNSWYPRELVRFIVWWLVAGCIWWQVAILHTVQYRKRKKEERE